MRLLLADDRSKVRSALRLLLEQEPELEIVGETADADSLLQAVETKKPDLVLLDWELPGLPAETLLRLIHCLHSPIQVIALSGRPEARRAAQLSGIDAFVSKGDPPERILSALNKVRNRADWDVHPIPAKSEPSQ